MGITTQIIGLIFSLSILVFVHELGHYAFARLFKTRVDKFYLFFNPWFSLVRAKKVGGKWKFSFFSTRAPKSWAEHPETTEWGIGWLPLGGYCSIAGMVDETTKATELATEMQDWEFRAKPAWQRLFIIVGGVLVNFITALVLYIAIFFTWGESFIPLENAKYGMQFAEVAQKIGFQNGDKIIAIDGEKISRTEDFVNGILINNVKNATVERNGEKVDIAIPDDFTEQVLASQTKSFCYFDMPFVVDKPSDGGPAAAAGFQNGDSLVAVNDSTIFSFFDFQKIFAENSGKAVIISYFRGDSCYQKEVTLTEDGKIGIYPYAYDHFFAVETAEYGILESVPKGIVKGCNLLVDYVKQMKYVFTKEGASQIGGFGTIGSIFPKEWDWERFWAMTAFLSVILAFMNFLPIPALDGGYILFILVEMITRRKPSDKFIGYANTIGFMLLLALLIYANGMDIFRAFFQ